MRRAAPLLMLLAAGCAGGQMGRRPPAVPRPPAKAACDARRARSFVGNAASEALGRQAQKAAGARTVRLITPGMIVSAEHRPDRLTVTIDDSGHVGAVRCG